MGWSGRLHKAASVGEPAGPLPNTSATAPSCGRRTSSSAASRCPQARQQRELAPTRGERRRKTVSASASLQRADHPRAASSRSAAPEARGGDLVGKDSARPARFAQAHGLHGAAAPMLPGWWYGTARRGCGRARGAIHIKIRVFRICRAACPNVAWRSRGGSMKRAAARARRTWQAPDSLTETAPHASHPEHRRQGSPSRRVRHQPRVDPARSADRPVQAAQRLRHRGRPRRRTGDHRGVARRLPGARDSSRGVRESGPESEYTWIIDPLDGTTNFIHGMPQYAVSIAQTKNGVLEHAVVHDPNTNEINHCFARRRRLPQRPPHPRCAAPASTRR